MTDFNDFYAIKCDPINIKWSGFAEAPKRDVLYEWFVKQLQFNKRKIYIAQLEGKTVAYFYLEQVNNDVYLSNGTGVPTILQEQGIGRFCVQKRDELVKSLGGREVIAWIAEENIASITMYQRCGYTKLDEYEYRFVAAFKKDMKFYKYVKYINE